MELNDLVYDEDDVEVIDEKSDDVVINGDEPPKQSDVLSNYLGTLGISDIHKIRFEDEDGTESERDWNDLSEEEQLNILSSGNSDPSTELDDEEIDLINRIRQSRMTPEQYIQSLIPNTQPVVEQPKFVVDDLSDDELYMLDLQARIEDITDEQLQDALNKAKENEELFTKQIKGIRDEYVRLEQEKQEQERLQYEEAANQRYQMFSNNIVNSIQDLTNIGDLDISMDDSDMNELASFILDRDETGTSYFAKALNNPADLVRMAWFALHGEEVFNDISDYYKKQIAQVSKTNYQKGYDDAKNGKGKASVVVKKTTPASKLPKSINNLIYN